MTDQALRETETGGTNAAGMPGEAAADRVWLSRLIESYDEVCRSESGATPCDGSLLRAARDHLMRSSEHPAPSIIPLPIATAMATCGAAPRG